MAEQEKVLVWHVIDAHGNQHSIVAAHLRVQQSYRLGDDGAQLIFETGEEEIARFAHWDGYYQERFGFPERDGVRL